MIHPRDDDDVIVSQPRFAARRRRRRDRRSGRRESSRFAYTAEVNFRVDSAGRARGIQSRARDEILRLMMRARHAGKRSGIAAGQQRAVIVDQ